MALVVLADKLSKTLILLLELSFVITVVQAQVNQSPEFVVEPPNNVKFSNYNGLAIDCRAKGLPPPNIAWVLSDGIPVSSVTGLRRVLDNGTLVFPPFKPEDYRQDIHAAVYRCSATNVFGIIFSREVQVQAVIPILSEAYEIYLTTSYTMKGNTAVIRCHLPQFNQEYLEISWVLDGRLLVPDLNVSSKHTPTTKYVTLIPGTLYVRNVQTSDSETNFQCQTRHKFSRDVKTSSIGNLLVTDLAGHMTPKIMDKTLPVSSTTLGSTAFIPCIAEGHPLASIQWLFKDDSKRQVSIPQNGHYVPIPEGLIIRKVEEKDATTFICIATNTVGSDRKETQLLVTVPLKVTVTPSSSRTDIGKTVSFRCDVTGYPNITDLMWMKDSKTLKSDDQFIINDNKLTIPKIKLNHRGVYQCFVRNGLSSAQGKTDLFLSDMLPEFSETFGEKILQAESSLNLYCSASGIPRPQIKWLFDDTPISLGVSTNGTNSLTRSSLSKLKLRADDGGLYTCIAENTAGQRHHTARINIYGPLAARPIKYVKGIAGDNLHLNCPVYGYPIGSVTWMKDNFVLPTDLQQVVLKNKTLVINRVQKSSDSGLYECTVRNDHGQSASSGINVTVLVKPKITPFQFQNGLKEGMRTQVQCVLSEGDSPSSIQWKRNGQPLQPDGRITIRSLDTYSSILIISSVSANDNGNYSCIAENEAAASTYTASLWVNVSPKLAPFAFQESSSTEGSYASVTCLILEGSLPITLQWLKDGQLISTNSNININVKQLDSYSSILTIQNVTKKHGGTYTCTATNSASFVQYSTELVVRVPPHWIIQPQNSTVKRRESIVIECQADGFPKPQIQWTKVQGNDPNGERQMLHSTKDVNILSNGSLQISQTKNDHQGFYFCSANNNVGKGLSKVIYLKVQAPVHFLTDTAEHSAKIGFSAEINCQAFGDKPIEIKWKFKNQILPLSKKYRTTVINTTSSTEKIPSVTRRLIISNISKSDDGIYECIASNMFGEATFRVNLTVLERPQPPEIITINKLDNRSVEIKWRQAHNGNSAIVKYTLQYKRKSESWNYKGTKIVNFDATTISGIVGPLQPAITYEFRLAAENAVGISNFSTIKAVSLDEEAPDGAPQQIEIEAIDPSSLRISWKPPVKSLWNGVIRGYYIYYKIHNLSMEYSTKTFEVPEDYTDNLVYQLSNLQMYTKYSIFVTAYNNGGSGPRTDEMIVMTSEDVPSESPTDIRCSSLSPRSIYVVWNDLAQTNINGILLGYKVVYKSVEIWQYGPRQENKTEFSRITLQNLEVYTNYSIQVLAYTRVGEGVASDAIFCKTYQDVPEAPEEIKALASSANSILVTWKKPKGKSSNVTKYNVYYKLLVEGEQIPMQYRDSDLDGRPHQSVNVHTIESANTVFEFKRLERNKSYVFWVKAVSTVGEGPRSSIVTASPINNAIPAKSASFDEIITAPWRTNVALPCWAVGIPMPRRIWRNGTSVIMSNDRIVIQYDGTLLIKKSSQSDSNVYTCYIENSHGKDSVRYSVTIQVPPQAPILSVLSKSINSIRLKWEDDGVTARSLGYKLHFKQIDIWKTIDLPGYVNTYTMEDLTCGTTYFIFIEAYNQIGIGDPCDTISVTTQEGVFTMPSKEALLKEADSYITVFLDAWPKRGCPLQYFTVQYKQQSVSEFTEIPTRYHSNEKQFILSGLEPASWYILRLTAHTDGEPNVAEYAFATTTKLGGTISPNSVQKEEKIVMFYLDPWIFIPVIALIITIIIASVVVWLFAKRRKNKRENIYDRPPPQWSEFGIMDGSPPDLGESVESFVHLQRVPPGTINRHIYGTLKRPREDPNPYATVHTAIFPPVHEMNLLMSGVPPPIPPGPGVSTLDRNRGWRYVECDAHNVPKNTYSWDQGYASADGENIYATTSRRVSIPNIHNSNTLKMSPSSFPVSETTFVFPNSSPESNSDVLPDYPVNNNSTAYNDSSS